MPPATRNSIRPPSSSIDGEDDENQNCAVSWIFRVFYDGSQAIVKSKWPWYLTIALYVVICLLGNIVTAIIYVTPKNKKTYNDTELITQLNTILSYNNDSVNEGGSVHTNQNIFEDTSMYDEYEVSRHTNISMKSLFLSFTNQKTAEIHDPEEICYEKIEDYKDLIYKVKYISEGVTLLVVGLLGLLGNFLSIIVLKRSRRNKGFNTLLIMLAVSDSLLISDSIVQKSIVPYFLGDPGSYVIDPVWYNVTFPYFWHPFKGIVLTITIYMMVAISFERYRAVCYPLSKRHSPYKYFSTVIITSIVLKLPRFFHFKTITIDGKPQYWTTHIMENPVYTRFSSYWDDLIVTGFLPLMVTIFFNLRIYLQVRRSAKLKCDRFVGTGATVTNQQLNSFTPIVPRPVECTELHYTAKKKDIISYVNENSDHDNGTNETQTRRSSSNAPTKPASVPNTPNKKNLHPRAQSELILNDRRAISFEELAIDITTNIRISNMVSQTRCSFVTLENMAELTIPIVVDIHLEQERKNKYMNVQELDANILFPENNLRQCRGKFSSHPLICRMNDVSEERPERRLDNDECRSHNNAITELCPSDRNDVCNDHEIVKNLLDGNTSNTKSSLTTNNSLMPEKLAPPASKLNVRLDRSAMLLTSIVILFILTHSYRMALKSYEILSPNTHTIENFNICFIQFGRHHVPILFYLLFHMNNLFIVINSSINVIVYYCVGKDFRKEAKTLYKDCKQKFCMCF